MAIYKNISSKAIIRKLMRDLKPGDDNWIDDAVEWVGEALEHIGSMPQLETKNCVLTVANYKTCLPADLYSINQVAINTSVAPTIESELDTLTEKVTDIQTTLAANPDQSLYAELREIVSRMTILQSLYFKEEDNMVPLRYGKATFKKDENCATCVDNLEVAGDWYVVENGYVKTSFLSGKLCISYNAFPTDEDCYPMVPDDISFKEAMFWYIYKQMLLSGFNTKNNGIDYNFADQKWRYYCTQARNNANYSRY